MDQPTIIQQMAELTNGEALTMCEEYGKEVLLFDRPQGRMLEILMEMKRSAADGTLAPDYYRAYTVAMEGFRQLFAPKEG